MEKTLMRTERFRSKAALKKGNRYQGISIIPKLGNESLSNRKLTIILLTAITALLKLTITPEEKNTECDFNFPFHKV